MKKGKKQKICGVNIYREFDKKSMEERGRSLRPVIFHSKKDYDRKRDKRILKKTLICQEAY